MSFEPTYDECLECPCYRQGNGKNWISRCVVEQGCEPSPFCPMTKDTYQPLKKVVGKTQRQEYAVRKRLLDKCKQGDEKACEQLRRYYKLTLK